MSLPSTGAMSEFNTGAVRDASAGKGLPSCIPPVALRKLAQRFEEGATKYSDKRVFDVAKIDSLLDSICNCQRSRERTLRVQSAIQTDGTRREESALSAMRRNTQKPSGQSATLTELASITDCANPATAQHSQSEIQPITSDKRPMPENGLIETQGEQGRYKSRTAAETHSLGVFNQETQRSPSLDFQPNSNQPSLSIKVEDAGFVDLNRSGLDSTLTTATKPNSREVSCVADATGGLDSWGIVLSQLSEHSNTCEIHRRLKFSVDKGGVIHLRDSKPNWMKGIPLSRYQDSLTRHMLSHAEGDTSEDHMGAILWNASAWAWTEEAIAKGLLPAELDDLPFRARL